MIKRKKPNWWLALMVLLSALYLIPEAVFNAWLVDVVGTGTSDPSKMRLTELFGRSISGVGVSLLLADFVINGRVLRRPFRALCYLFLIVLCIWPIVFFGQKMLVDHFLIEPSSAKQRQEALFATALRFGLAANAIEFEGIPYDPEQSNCPGEKTFLSLIGGMVFFNEEFLQSVDDQKEKIIKTCIYNWAGKNLDSNYEKYKNLCATVIEKWGLYGEATQKYMDVLNTAPERAEEAWEEIDNRIIKGFADYETAYKTFDLRAAARAPEIAPDIYDIFNDRNDFLIHLYEYDYSYEQVKKKLDYYEQRHRRVMKKYGLPSCELKHWCTSSTRIGGRTNLKEIVFSLGLSVLQAGIDILEGNNGKELSCYEYTSSKKHYKKKLLELWEDDFKRQTGYPMGIEDITSFRNHPITRENIRKELKGRGVELPETWEINDEQTFDKAIEARVVAEANKQWENECEKLGLTMKPKMNWGQFQRHPDVQDRIREQMGENYVDPMLAGWNNQEFYDHVIVPNIDRKTNYWIEFIEASRAQFADGAPHAEDGKTALRTILIPPISIGLSLFLVVMTVFKLPLRVWFLWRYHEDRYIETSDKPWIGWGVKVVIVFLILWVPVSFSPSKYISKESSISYFLNKMETVTTPAGAYFVKWVMSAQPVVHPVGHFFNAHLNITSFFERYLMNHIAKFDEMGNHSGRLHREEVERIKQQIELLKENREFGLAPFSITTNVPDPSIKLLHIQKEYRPGMSLPVNLYYEVELSGDGYQTKRIWLKHDSKNKPYSVILRPLGI